MQRTDVSRARWSLKPERGTFCIDTSMMLISRLLELDADFQRLLAKEHAWPSSVIEETKFPKPADFSGLPDVTMHDPDPQPEPEPAPTRPTLEVPTEPVLTRPILDEIVVEPEPASTAARCTVTDAKSLYADFYDDLHARANDIVCACCGCIEHMLSDVEMVPASEPYLALLAANVDSDALPFEFASGIPALDSQRIMIDRAGIISPSSEEPQDPHLTICKPCHYKLHRNQLPPRALANRRWLGEVPRELQGFTWLEEKLLARRHLVGTIVRLQQRHGGYLGLKGHMILVPQNTTELVNLLPRSPSSLPDMVRVVWTGREPPKHGDLQGNFTINKQRVHDALVWLIKNNRDYKDVDIDREEFSKWPPVFVADALLESMGRVMDPSPEDATRSGVATDDPDSSEIHGDLPVTTSCIVDVNNLFAPHQLAKLETLKSLSENAVMLNRHPDNRGPSASEPNDDIAESDGAVVDSLSENATINVVTGNAIKNYEDDPSYFTSAFPVLFPYGTGGHKDQHRTVPLSLSDWVRLLLRHSSRYCPSVTSRYDQLC